MFHPGSGITLCHQALSFVIHVARWDDCCYPDKEVYPSVHVTTGTFMHGCGANENSGCWDSLCLFLFLSTPLSMDIDLSQVEHWIYGAEGNETIVLRYIGDNPRFVCRPLLLIMCLILITIWMVEWIRLAPEEAKSFTKGSRSIAPIFTGLFQSSHYAIDRARIHGAIGRLFEASQDAKIGSIHFNCSAL